jgi:hypothetical protein
MITARQYKYVAIFAIFAVLFASQLVPVVKASAGSSRSCTLNSTCTVGEFLYDDNYSPINIEDICTLTTRDPDGTLLHDNQSMALSPNDDGWYSYSFTAPATTGYYRASVCCTVGSEHLCIDKSFEVTAANEGATSSEIASAVWLYSDRTLSGFGNMAFDVWNYSGRSLTTFGSLVTNIWDSASRTLTGTQATKIENIGTDTGDLTEIKKKVNENRLLLEKLVNEPIIQNFIEEDEPDISKKLDETKVVTGQLYINDQYVESKVAQLVSKWRVTSASEMLDVLMDVEGVLGESGDSDSHDTVFGAVNWLSSNWNWRQISDINDQTVSISRSITRSKDILATSGKNQAVYQELNGLSAKFDSMNGVIGQSTDKATDVTLHSKIKETQNIAQVLDDRQSEVEKMLTGFNGEDKSLSVNIDQIKKKIFAVNKVPKAQMVLVSNDKDVPISKLLKNKLLGLRAVVIANKKLLAKGTQNPLANTWLEEGSIVFKSLITNPSTLISQDVPLKYYLPAEVREEDILEIDSGLTKGYDAEKNQYFVEGKFTLKPGETKTLSVRVEDIWVITEAEVESLRKQSEELVKPLEKTSFYAQGVTFKTDIAVSLDKIVVLQKAAITPEQQIRAYREASLELTKVTEVMGELQALVTQSGNTGTLLGFVGGAQTLAVWGLIIIMSAGFVFLALYMKVIAGSHKGKPREKSGKKDSEKPIATTNGYSKSGSLVKIAFSMFVVAIISALLSGLFVKHTLVKDTHSDTPALSENKDEPQEEVMSAEDEKVSDGSGGQDIVKIVGVSGSRVIVYSAPNEDSEVVTNITTEKEAVKVEEDDDWVRIAFDLEGVILEGWVKADNVVTKEVETTGETSGNVVILDTPTGWLRVRKTPEGAEISKAKVGETFELLGVEAGWYQIILTDDSTGWISKEYSEIVSE